MAPNELIQQTNKQIRDETNIEHRQTNLQTTTYTNRSKLNTETARMMPNQRKTTYLPGFSSLRKISRKSNSSNKERVFRRFGYQSAYQKKI